MKIELHRLDEVNARLTLIVEYADYASKLDENIKKYSKKLNIKGFRAGKTPKSVLSKMYGKGVLEETVAAIMNEQLFDYLKEQDIQIFGSPLLSDLAEPLEFELKTPKDYTFIFDLGLKPDFTLAYNLDQPVEVSIPEVDLSGIDDNIIRYRRLFGNDETVTDGTVQAFDKVGLLLDRTTEPNGIIDEPVDIVVDLEHVTGTATESLTGLAIGAILDLELEGFMGQERSVILKNTLYLDEDPAPDTPLAFKATLTSISRPQRTPLTGEQLSKLTGHQVEDEARFREMLERREQDSIKSRVNDMKKMAVRLALIQANPFIIPEDFLLRWINQQRDKKIENHTRESRQLMRDAGWAMLLNRIADQEGLEVSENDIRKQMTQWIVQNVNYMQTDIRKLMDQLYANEYFMSNMKENALEEVVFAHMIPKFRFEENVVTEEAFETAFHDLHHQIFDHGDHDHHHDHQEHDHSQGEHEHSHG